ncbi:MAG: hypothetical protein OEQ74_07260 [Gammaproteobacteria bacterium]|nr:hypothetical protein [Gammaproteobacteria bacterium]
MNVGKFAAMTLIWIAGVMTIIASSSTDDDEPVLAVPVTVDFTLTTLAVPLKRELETRTAELDTLSLHGSYSANQGDKLTLDRSSITLDTGSEFQITITAETTEELLAGAADIAVSAAFDIGIGHNPVAGRFSSLFGGTTTVVTVTSGGVDVVIGGATTADFHSWSDFEDREDDENADLNLRMASAAYNMFDVVLRATLLAEDIIDDVEDNKETLEGMFNSALTLTCNNTADEGEGQSRLLWTADASGSGADLIGQGDAFEARYVNCRDANLDRILDGNMALANYNPDNDTGFSIFGIDATLFELFFSETPVDIDTVIDATSPRYSGTLRLSYTETADSL